MAVTLEQFVESLTESSLLSPDEFLSFQQGLPPEQRPTDAQALARQLVRANKLTKYQAKAVYQGKAKSLVLGDYVLLDKLGQGGMGVVFKARHRRMERVVALKVLPAAAMKKPESVQRFYREVKAAARLSHPNIVTAHDAREHEGTHCFVMEYVDGKDLSQVLADHRLLPLEEAVNCIIQAARGLEYAHSQGVVHRDIKPSNLLLDKKGSVKILDMGLARIFEGQAAGGPDRLTDSGQMMGTCDYMAPEQAEDTHHVDHRADIYSLGCTFYRLVTGNKPYPGQVPIQILYAHREAPVPSLRDERPEVPVELDRVFQKTVAKRPEDRYPSMTELIAALEACISTDSAVPVLSGSSGDTSLASFLQPGVATRDEAKVAEGTIKSYVEEETGKFWRRLLPRRRSSMVLYVGIVGAAAVFVVVMALLAKLVGPAGTTSPEPEQAPSRLAVAPFDADEAGRLQKAWADYLGVPVIETNSIGMQMVLIPPGEFMMGSTDDEISGVLDEAEREKGELHEPWADRVPSEGPRHTVKITQPFYLGVHEVTVRDFKALAAAKGYLTNAGKPGLGGQVSDGEQSEDFTWRNPGFPQTDKHPVVWVSWNDADAFCQWLTDEEGKNYHLPSEAQWEYACRAGSIKRFHFGDRDADLGRYAWYEDEVGSGTKPVGRKLPNGFGLFDVHGNVWEWCRDRYRDDYYASSPEEDPNGPSLGNPRVLRGGSYHNQPRFVRAACRAQRLPANRDRMVGFRVARDCP